MGEPCKALMGYREDWRSRGVRSLGACQRVPDRVPRLERPQPRLVGQRGKLFTADVRELRRRAEAGEEWRHLAFEFGISERMVERVVAREVWPNA